MRGRRTRFEDSALLLHNYPDVTMLEGGSFERTIE